MKTFHQIIIRSKATNEKTDTKRILPVYTQEIDPKINPERIKAELLKSQIKLKQTTKRNTFNNFANTKSNINKTFRTLNHPYPMKIAIIKRNLRKSSTTSNHKSSTTKETYQIKNLGVSSNFQH
jgi:Trk K+ transport system NAD-binding subunit